MVGRLFALVGAIVMALSGTSALGETPEHAAGWVAYRASEKASGAERDRLARESLKQFEAGCAKDDADSCATIAREGYLTKFYTTDRATRRQAAADRAAATYHRGCVGAGAFEGTLVNRSCMNLADLVRSMRNGDSYYPQAERTDGLPKYVALAADVFLEKCGVDYAGSELDCMAATQLMTVSNPKRAGEIREILCNGESTWACHDLGRLSAGEKKGLEALDAQCKRKDGSACFKVGGMWYTMFKFDPAHQEKALTAFTAGCAANDMMSCGGVAQLKFSGPAQMRDNAGGAAAIEKACAISKDAASTYCKNAEKVRQALAAAAAKPS